MNAAVRSAIRRLLMLCGLALLTAAPAAAAHVELVQRGCRIATAADATVEQLLARPLDAPCPRPPGRNAQGTIWIDYAASELMPDPERLWRVLIDGTRVRSVDLYVLRENGTIDRVRYDPYAADRQWSPGGYFSLTLEQSASPARRMLIRFGGIENASLVRSIQVVRWRDSVMTERRNAALFGAAVGILGLTILFHSTLFFAIRRRFQLLYCANAAMLFGYGLVYSGLLQFLIPVSGPAIPRLTSLFLTAAGATGIAFLVDFVERRALPPWLRSFALASVGAIAVIAVANILTPLSLTTPVAIASQIAGGLAILLVCVLLAVAVARGSRTARLLSLGWAGPVAIAALIPLRASGLVGHFAIPDGIVLYAATFECMLLSLPVANRIRRLRIDHERARERQHLLERQARTDALTGLANRRGFAQAIRRAFSGANPQAAALLLIDIDHFKSVNDIHGHSYGDMILRRVAEHVAKTAGPGAIVARFGGEEFVVAFRGYDEKRAGTMAERIRIGMESLCADDPVADAVTVSIGVACGPGSEIDALIERADQALYEAKRRGRDCVVIGEPVRKAAA